jgi:uncharacterized integral membrane protein
MIIEEKSKLFKLFSERSDSMTDAEIGALLAVGGFMLLFFLLGLVFYILFSLGLYTMAKRRSIPNPWLAWIPIAQLYMLGEVIGPVKLGDFTADKPGLYLLGAIIGLWVLSFIPILGPIFSLANLAVAIGALYLLFSRYTTGNTPILYTILGVASFGALMAIFVFTVRNNEYLPADESAAT